MVAKMGRSYLRQEYMGVLATEEVAEISLEVLAVPPFDNMERIM
jgi:hypothetical protein